MGDAPDLLLHSPSPLLPLERAGSSQTQGLPATSKQTAAKRKRVTLPRMPLATTRKQPYAPANVHTPDSHHATVKPSRQERTRRRECEHQAETLFIAANSEPPRRTARCNHLMGLLMPSMPGKPRPASSSRRRAQGRSPPARCSSCQNRASWRAGPWCS